MKKIFIFIGIVAFCTASNCSRTSHKAAVNESGPNIEFETSEHDYGTIPYKGDGTYDFVFKNTGKEPLVLKNVRSSCGCTVPEWPKEPINKGEKGIIKVSYNTRITGSFSKSISVYSNAGEAPVVLVIKGNVEGEKIDKSGAPELIN